MPLLGTKHDCTAGDPKDWPATVKYIALLNLCFYVFLGNMYSVRTYMRGFPELAVVFRVGFVKLTDLISWSVLALGVASILWMPLALCIGKRPIAIITLFVFLAGSIWSQYATSFDDLLGARVMASIGAGSVETLGPSMIADMFHERRYATAIGCLQIFLAMGTQIGPLIAGYLIQARGWQWFFKLTSILIGINIISVIFFLPETTFRRNVVDGESAVEPMLKERSTKSDIVENVEYLSTVDENAPYAGSYWKDLFQFRNRGLEAAGIRKIHHRAIEPLQFLAVPQIVYAGVLFGLFVGGVVVISALGPAIFTPPPYLFTSVSLGLFSLASMIGCIVAFPLAGPLTDFTSQLMRKCTGGQHEPEHRMPALIMPFLLCPPGLVLFTYTVAQHKSYVIAGVGFAMQSAGVVLVPSVVLAFTVDAYPRRSGEALVLINAIKNCVAFGITKGVSAWFVHEGLKDMFIEMAGIQWGILFLALPLYFVSPWLRQKTVKFL